MRGYFLNLILAPGLALTLSGCRNLYDKQVETPTKKNIMQPMAAISATELGFEREAMTHHALHVKSLYCQPDARGEFATDGIFKSGEGEDPEAGDYVYGEGGGCINRPIADVWAVSMNQALMVWPDDKNNNSATWDVVPPPLGIAKYFAVHYAHKEEMKLKSFVIHWDMNWIHQVRVGDDRHPGRIMINYHKYMGEKHMYYWQGTIILDRVDANRTGFYMRDQLRIARTSADDAKSDVRNIFEKLKTGAPALEMLPRAGL